MQDKNVAGQPGEMMVLTPFSGDSKPDAFKFMLCGVSLCLIGICTFFYIGLTHSPCKAP
jgi:hypothetical protein